MQRARRRCGIDSTSRGRPSPPTPRPAAVRGARGGARPAGGHADRPGDGARPRSGTRTARPSPPRPRSAGCSPTWPATPPSWPPAWSPAAPTSPRRPTSAAGSTRPASGRSASATTGSPTTRERLLRWSESRRAASTSSSASPRSTSSASSASSARPGRRWGQRLIPIAHHLRPVRQPRPRALVVRHLRRRAVDPRRHPVRRDARAGGRRPPVDHHAVHRPRAARLHRLGARLRPGPRVDVPARHGQVGVPGGTSSYFRLSTRPLDPALANAARRPGPARATPPPGGRRRLPPVAAPGHARRRSRSSASARSCPRCSRPPRSSASRASTAGVVCLTSPDLVFRSFQQRGSRDADRRRRRHRGRAVPRARAAPRW